MHSLFVYLTKTVIKTSFIKALEAEPNQERVPLICKGDEVPPRVGDRAV